ncbi:SDR family NAD(P)-dependent oxidoreductase [Acuticoccus sp. 2012]|uniref:SDR family NAD(P)-dependent oxidoreductase n=1 Tax=Acuticoccus mangrovi TaxID=2796142 RepID=A0A934MEG9_9HYPH|nr:SDR family NAD(P)-dependent oxidoreductase [Acuticoccus mangrovi]
MAIVDAALTAGHTVVATARDVSALEATYGHRDGVAFLSLDVTDATAAQGAVEFATSRFGRVDVLVNCAGISRLAAAEDATLDDIRGQIDVNFFGSMNLTKAVLPLFREQGSGHILQISSVGDRLAGAGMSGYQASKWAITAFSLAVAAEVAPLGVKVTVVEPGAMRLPGAPSSMVIGEISPPYEPTVGARARRKPPEGSASLPSTVADLLIRVVDMPEPPLRLLVGRDAVEAAQRAADSLAEMDQRWRTLSLLDVAPGRSGDK